MATMRNPHSTPSPRLPYAVQEPDDAAEAASEQSASIDGSEQIRFSMTDMMGYLQDLQTDRCRPLLHISPTASILHELASHHDVETVLDSQAA